SNLYRVATGDESASVQRGVISATTNLTARKGTFKTYYRGPVYVTDAMTNNPGAAGGAVTTMQGDLLGLIGKELRNSQDNTWLNYAIPVEQLRESTEAIIAGKQGPEQKSWEQKARNPVDLAALGVVLVTDVVDNTPPFIDGVRPDSVAEAAGLQQDDLILFIDNVLVQSLDDLHVECHRIEQGQVVAVTVRRGDEMKVIELATVVD
ncbi:MAG: S1C family serine protease, partial [Planctomycetales bacterium]